MRGFIKNIEIAKYPQIFGDNRCMVCGARAKFKFKKIINDTLANEWGIDWIIRRGFDKRESSFCALCGSNLRSRQLAKAVIKIYSNGKQASLKDLAKLPSFQKIKIAEINSCGNLHETLKDLPLLHYSEFCPPNNKICRENLEKLSYGDNFFDLVLTSDTLEHVPDLKKSFQEIYRVLKPGGNHIFTVPVIASRKTRERAIVRGNGVIERALPDSFHGSGESDNLVFREFGGDLFDLLIDLKFKTEIYFYNFFGTDFSFVIVCRK